MFLEKKQTKEEFKKQDEEILASMPSDEKILNDIYNIANNAATAWKCFTFSAVMVFIVMISKFGLNTPTLLIVALIGVPITYKMFSVLKNRKSLIYYVALKKEEIAKNGVAK